MPGEAVERDQTQRVDVGAAVELVSGELLWAHVLGRAHHEPGLGHLLRVARARLRDPEVHHLHQVRPVAVLRDHDVVGLQVAVHDPRIMRDLQRVARLVDDAPGPRRWQRAGLLDQARQRTPLDELHREVDHPVGRLAEIVDAADVRMAQPRGVRRLAVESRNGIGIGVHPRVHHLERALAPHLHVLSEVHRSHAAFAELLEDVIPVGDDRAEEVRLGVRRAQRTPVPRAEALGEGILGAARRTDLLVAQTLSTRKVWSPIRMRWPGFT